MIVAEIKKYIDKQMQDLAYQDTHNFTKNGRKILKNDFQNGYRKGVMNELRVINIMLDQLEQDQKERIDQTLNFYQATKNSNVKSVKTDVVIIDLENMKKGLGYDNTRD